MRLAYSLLFYLLLPTALARLWWRGRKAPAYRQRWAERLGLFQPPAPGGLWLHAVSVGETRAALPLIKALQARYPDLPLTVTTTTPTGSQQVRQTLGDSVFHVYAPYDTPDAVRRFLDRVRPRLALIMETELWPNLFHHCARRGIPVIVANARLSARSARGYGRVRPLLRPALAQALIAAQADADAARFRTLGAVNVTVTGNLKFDLAIAAALREQGRQLRARLGADRPLWIAASTHAGEDEQVLTAHARLRQTWPELLLLLVPRHPERFDSVARLCRERGFNVQRRSRNEGDTTAAVYLGDTLGELLLMLAAADVAFVGGSLVAVGGHNVLEPAALGLPTLFGPQMFNFTEAARLLLAADAARQINHADELAAAVADWLSNPVQAHRAGARGQAVVEQNRGALARLLLLIEQQLAP